MHLDYVIIIICLFALSGFVLSLLALKHLNVSVHWNPFVQSWQLLFFVVLAICGP